MQLQDKSVLFHALRNITRTVQAAHARVQAVAVQAVAYSIVHRDISIGLALMDAVGVNKSLRRDSLVAYLEKYGNFAYLKTEKKLAFFYNTTAAEAHAANADEYFALITSKKWDEAKREAPIVSVYDMEESVRAFIGKMHKVMKDTAITVENRDVLEFVEQAFNRIVAVKTLASMKADEEVLAEGEKQQAVADAKAKADAEAKAKADAEAAQATPPTEGNPEINAENTTEGEVTIPPLAVAA